MDLLRLAGVPGVGKSTVAWAIAQQLAADGVRLGYVDIDQLGMCYPGPDGDTDRWQLKETALALIAARFAVAGAERLIVSGVADPAEALSGNGHPTVALWLDADEATRRERLAPRGWTSAQLENALAVGSRETRDAYASWARIPTDGHSVEETAATVLARWGAGVAEAAPARTVEAASGRVIWLTGPRCAGASMVGWEIASARWEKGERTGFIDAAQLGFRWNIDHEVGAGNVAALHRLFSGAGARTTIVAAPFEIAPSDVRAAFPGADVLFVRLHADASTTRDRVRRRVGGDGPRVIGDDLIGASREVVEGVVATAMRQRQEPLREGEVLVETTGSTVAEVAALIVAHLAG
ncbi:Adenylyl-sulfate kinase [Microbacterium sp. SA39]|nr:Adenylyl-sulfate kinase [Microbacterium sp. SA39]